MTPKTRKIPLSLAPALLLALALLLLVMPASVPLAHATTCGTGSNITFTDIGSGQCRGFITATGAGTFTVPSDWNSSSNSIEVIGGGGGGSDYPTGGGGGAYSASTSVALTPGGTVGIAVGTGGAGGATGPSSSFNVGTAGGDTYLCNSTSNCASIAGTAVVVGAKGGDGGAITAVLTSGGSSASGVGGTKVSGGNSPAPVGNGSGGGGAGGPLGAGAAGGQSTGSGGAGGGGNGGGSAGAGAPANDGGNGGNNFGGTGGGAGGVYDTSSGSPGTNGGGGGGGGYAATTNLTGGAGGAGTEWDATHGSGGGGGGGGSGGTGINIFGGNGGLYGGGGGAGGYNNGNTTGYKGGDGGQGIIVVTYTPTAPATGRIIRLTGGLRLVGGVRLAGTSPIPSSVCSQATAYLARVTVDGAHQTAYKNLICGLVADGLWGKFDVLYIFATANSSAALTNLVSTTYSATAHGSPAFAADQGYTTGSDQWVDTGLNLSTSANFTQDSAMMGAWNLTATPDYNAIVTAAISFGGVNYLRPNDAGCPSGCMAGEVNSSSVFDTGDGSIASGAGLVMGNRPDSTRFQFWQNTTQVGGDMVRGSTAPDNAVLETAGDTTAYANGGAFQIAAVFAGAGLTSTDISNFYGRMRTYMTAVGLP